MSISPYKTWSSGEVLTAADLNASFTQITNNALSLISPLTGSLDANGNEIILDADADTSITSDTDDRVDVRAGGVDVFRIDGTTASSVNGLDVVSAATGSAPRLSAQGTDSNIDVDVRPKGTGGLQIRGMKLQSFALRLINDGGTLKHQISYDNSFTALGNFSDKIGSASATLTATPTGADGSTAMAAGGKISSAATNTFILDTADMTPADFIGIATVEDSNADTPVYIRARCVSRDVNGTTRDRVELSFIQQSDGSSLAIATLLNVATEYVDVRFIGVIP